MSSSYKLQSHRENNTKVIISRLSILYSSAEVEKDGNRLLTFVNVFRMVFQNWVKGILLLCAQNSNFRHLFCFAFSLSLFLSTSLFLYFLRSLHLSAVWKYS